MNGVDQLPRRIRRIKLFTDNSSPVFKAVSYRVYRGQSVISVDGKHKKKAAISVYLIYDPVDADGEIILKWSDINPEIIKAIIGNRKPWFVSKPTWIQHMFRCWVSFYYLIDVDVNKRSCKEDENPTGK